MQPAMKKISSRILGAALVAIASPAVAYSGGPLVGFAQSLLDFLTSTLGPIVFGLGIAVAAYGFFLGHREEAVAKVIRLISAAQVGTRVGTEVGTCPQAGQNR